MQKFKVGDIVYSVMVFRSCKNTSCTEGEVLKINTTMKYVKCPSMILMENGFRHEVSLEDNNIIPNGYNCHRIFKTKEEADNYINNPKLWRPLKDESISRF